MWTTKAMKLCIQICLFVTNDQFWYLHLLYWCFCYFQHLLQYILHWKKQKNIICDSVCTVAIYTKLMLNDKKIIACLWLKTAIPLSSRKQHRNDKNQPNKPFSFPVLLFFWKLNPNNIDSCYTEMTSECFWTDIHPVDSLLAGYSVKHFC